ncbi:Hypothetical predicted protein [Paramuricea clavata]|uniref:Uncharacterized protein n=1 Tax=Paramuricea clavata TaxID=317549 RepID=A0A7D9I3N0_PARCT|nr:Hypothetical predicted protein [Paramuricea clavata]
MNAPHASHLGGVWERQIKTVGSVITALMTELGDQLDDETLRPLFTEAENIVNTRPLTADISDSDNLAKQNLQVGDIVIDKDEDLPRNQWQLAKVTKTYPNDDGLVRKVEIQKATGNLDKTGRRKNSLSSFERPIHKLTVLLEMVEQVETERNVSAREQ